MPADTMLDAHVRGYAQAVRIHLADLAPDVVEELTGGLEADLAEADTDRLLPHAGPAATGAASRAAAVVGAADTEADDDADAVLDLVQVFGQPARYAAELRAAAGLPAPVVPAVAPPRRRGRLRAAVRERAARTVRRLRAAAVRASAPVTASPGWAKVREAALELTPVWWVARGWVVGSFVVFLLAREQYSLVPTRTSDLLGVLAVTVVSVQWGRGRWRPWRWVPRLVTVASVAAVLLVLPLTGATVNQARYGGGSGWQQGYDAAVADARSNANGLPVASWQTGSPSGADGVWVDGLPVSNLFAYDGNGDPLRDVQIFDDRGRPVRTVAPGEEWLLRAIPDVDGTWFLRPSLATDGRSRWNVYPLTALAESDAKADDQGEPRPAVGARTRELPWPFLKAPTAIDRPAPTTTPQPDESPAPDESPVPDESPAPDPTPAPQESAPSGAPGTPAGTTAPTVPDGGPVAATLTTAAGS
jgi:hypothetical protein